MKQFGSVDEADSLTQLPLLETRQCTTEDFNNAEGTNEESRFYKTPEREEMLLKSFGPFLKCLKDPDSLEMWGSVQAGTLNSLMIAFIPCSNSTSSSGVVCKS